MSITNDQYKAVEQAIEYMKRYLDKDLTSEELAFVVGYSPFHFSRMFKEATGIPPRQYLSALRIEAGKQMLVNPSTPSILKTLLSIGFRSVGTFGTKFKRFVGLSPKQFQLRVNDLHQFINQYDKQEKALVVRCNRPVLSCELEVPKGFRGLIFVGIFPRPIPDQKPVIGTAFRHHQTSCLFTDIPPGTYHVLVATLPISLNPKDYFLLGGVLRGKYEYPIEVTEHIDKAIHIKLRKPLPFDPPILVNLPQLLFEKENNKANEEKIY